MQPPGSDPLIYTKDFILLNWKLRLRKRLKMYDTITKYSYTITNVSGYCMRETGFTFFKYKFLAICLRVGLAWRERPYNQGNYRKESGNGRVYCVSIGFPQACLDNTYWAPSPLVILLAIK